MKTQGIGLKKSIKVSMALKMHTISESVIGKWQLCFNVIIFSPIFSKAAFFALLRRSISLKCAANANGTIFKGKKKHFVRRT